jgi:hypothetical protein
MSAPPGKQIAGRELRHKPAATTLPPVNCLAYVRPEVDWPLVAALLLNCVPVVDIEVLFLPRAHFAFVRACYI